MDDINIKKLAKDLNLSTSTISRAFRGNSDISQATKERILAKAKELNYQPNLYASNLREKKSKTIAVIMPELANNFFSEAVNGIERVARDNGYHTLLYVTDDDYQKEVAIIDDLSNGRVDGIIMSASGEANDHNYLGKLKKKKIPLVFFDRVYDDVDVAKVTTNDYASSFEGTRHLIEAGCKKIAFLVINKSLSIGKMRMQGYVDALREAGIPYRQDWVIDCSNDREESIAIITKVLTTLHPDGIFASVERLAMASYYACHALGVKIPEQVKVISYSSLEIAPLLNPSLTTITQPAGSMGAEAARLLFKTLEAATPALVRDHLVLSSKIIQRRSTEAG
ncbi:MAG TPA: LacI family DNA-binding transcriptional regulator [Chitinophaga sp.]